MSASDVCASSPDRVSGLDFPTRTCDALPSGRRTRCSAATMEYQEMTKFLGWFVAGAMTMILVAATSSSFRLGDEPELTNAFTYHGQLKSGGDPYSGLADVRLTLWNDAFTGVQVGRTADFEGITVEDGLFAVEPDFGPDAFNGARRWIEVAVRAPAGSGGYLTLDPRQAVNATPYALYALNGQVGPEGPEGPPGDSYWSIDPVSESAWIDRHVGVGSPPAEALFRVTGPSGDETVILPDDSVGDSEILGGLTAAATIDHSASGQKQTIRSLTVEGKAGQHLVFFGQFYEYDCHNALKIWINGEEACCVNAYYADAAGLIVLSGSRGLVDGTNLIELRSSCPYSSGYLSGGMTFVRVGRSLELIE